VSVEVAGLQLSISEVPVRMAEIIERIRKMDLFSQEKRASKGGNH
jgi:hypothetical protein